MARSNETYQYMKKGTSKILVDASYIAQKDLNGDVITETYAKKTEVAQVQTNVDNLTTTVTAQGTTIGQHTTQIGANTEAIATETSRAQQKETELGDALNNKQTKLKPGTNITMADDPESGMVIINASGMVSVNFEDIAGEPSSNAKLKAEFDGKQTIALVTTMDGADDTHYASAKAVKDFVNSSIQSETAFFDGSWATKSAIPTTEQGFIDAGLPAPSNNNYLVVLADETHSNESWRYKYVSSSATYDPTKWVAEYKINDTPFSDAQMKAINSGATTEKITAYDGHIVDTVKHITAEERTAWNNKVDKVEGMGLSHNDFTNEYKDKLDSLVFTEVVL